MNIGYSYDTAGRQYWTKNLAQRRRYTSGTIVEQGYDGDGQRVKQTGGGSASYFVRSSALGGAVVYELKIYQSSFYKKEGFVYANGQMIANQSSTPYSQPTVNYLYTNPITGSKRSNTQTLESESDPMDNPIGLSAPEPDATTEGISDIISPRFADALNLDLGCTIDGAAAPCDLAASVDDLLSQHDREVTVKTEIFIPGADLMDSPMPSPSSSDEPTMGFATRYSMSAKGKSEDQDDIIRVETRVPKLKQDKQEKDKDKKKKKKKKKEKPTVLKLNKVELRANIIERLDRNGGGCRAFLDALRDNLGIDETIEDLFDEVIKNGGNFVTATDISSRGVANYGKGGKDVGFSPSTSETSYVNSAIHELIHRAGIDKHIAFAKAGFKSLSDKDKAKFPLPTKEGEGDRTMNDAYSSYFSTLMNEYCRPPE